MKIGIIASGPSATREDAETLAAFVDSTIAVNDSWRLLNADHLWASDFKWWRHHLSAVKAGFKGQGHTQLLNWPTCPHPTDWGLNYYRADRKADGLSTDPSKVHTGRNSGYAAINLALHLGATDIYLLGYDMHGSHWFGEHPAGLNAGCDPSRFIPRFETIKPEEYGLNIWNCSRETALTCFPIVSLEELT